MGIKPTIFGYVCDTDRLRATAQERRMIAHDVNDICVEGRRVGHRFALATQTIGKLLRRVRSIDTIAVDRLFVLAPEGRDRHAKLVARMAKIADLGVHVWELSTGRNTRKSGDRDKMLADAMRDLSRVGKSKSTGRPRREYTAEQIEVVERHWHSAQHARDADALAAIQRDGLTDWTLNTIQHAKKPDGSLLFGPSGRPYAKRKSRKK